MIFSIRFIAFNVYKFTTNYFNVFRSTIHICINPLPPLSLLSPITSKNVPNIHVKIICFSTPFSSHDIIHSLSTISLFISSYPNLPLNLKHFPSSLGAKICKTGINFFGDLNIEKITYN